MIMSSVCLLSALSGLTAAAAGIATASVKNLCTTPVYIWSVDSDSTGPFTIQPNAVYTEAIHMDAKAGVAIKITRIPQGIFKNAPQLQFQYNAEPPHLWLDLHEINGHPFEGSPVSVVGCGKEITWPTGIDYKDPTGTGNGTVHCKYGQSTTLILCGLNATSSDAQSAKVKSRRQTVQ